MPFYQSSVLVFCKHFGTKSREMDVCRSCKLKSSQEVQRGVRHDSKANCLCLKSLPCRWFLLIDPCPCLCLCLKPLLPLVFPVQMTNAIPGTRSQQGISGETIPVFRMNDKKYFLFNLTGCKILKSCDKFWRVCTRQTFFQASSVSGWKSWQKLCCYKWHQLAKPRPTLIFGNL